MDDRVEAVLQIDPLAEAVGCDEHTTIVRRQFGDALLAYWAGAVDCDGVFAVVRQLLQLATERAEAAPNTPGTLRRNDFAPGRTRFKAR